jgi:hypothetical protein
MMASDDKQISLTDPDARSMATSGKSSGIVGYNVQRSPTVKAVGITIILPTPSRANISMWRATSAILAAGAGRIVTRSDRAAASSIGKYPCQLAFAGSYSIITFAMLGTSS